MTGKSVNIGYVYYAQSHQRQLVQITPELRQSTIDTIASVQNLLITGIMPKPIYSKRCKGCSLYSQCLPEVREKMSRYQEEN